MDSWLLLLGHLLLGYWRIWIGVGLSGIGAFVPRRFIGVRWNFFGSSGRVGVVDVAFAVLIVRWFVYLTFFSVSLRMGSHCLFDMVALYSGVSLD